MTKPCDHLPSPMRSRVFCIECSRRQWLDEQGAARIAPTTEADLEHGYRNTPRPYAGAMRRSGRTLLALVGLLVVSCGLFFLGVAWDGRGTKDLTVDQAAALVPLTVEPGSRRALAWLIHDKVLKGVEVLQEMVAEEDSVSETASVYLDQIRRAVNR